MATAIKLRSDIRKLKKAIDTKGISASIKDKLKSQLQKAESELANMKKGKKPSKSSTGGTKTALSKLQSIIKKKKYGAYRAQGVDLKKDADRPALRSGKRTSKSGNTYYEYRANRIDVKQPPKRYPKLEDGGMMAEGGRITKGLKWKQEWTDTKGVEGYDILEVDDTNYFSNRYSGGMVVRSKIIESSKPERIGNFQEETKAELRKILLGKYPFAYKLKDGGYMAGGGRVMPFLKFEYATEARKKLGKGQLPVFDGGAGFDYLEKEKKLYYLPSVTGDWQEVGEFKSKKESIDWLSDQLKMEGFAKGGYMAGGGNVSKSYEKIEGTDYELKIQVYYDKGGMNYFTSRPEARGYYLSVSPVQVERRENGIMVESYAAFSGIKALVLPVQRQSPKAEKQAEELAQKMMPELKEQVTSNLKRKLGMMAEGGMMEMRDVVSEEQQMAKGGQIDDLVAKQTEFLAQLTDIKLGADLETEEGVLNYRNQIAPIREKLSVIEDELEMLGYEAYEKGGYMKKGGLTLGDISKKYDENEDKNYHTENVVLLATHFGTANELRDAKTIKAKHDAIGHLPFNLYEERNELGDKLYERMIEQIRENGMGAKPQKVVLGVAKEYINPDYMAKGGEMHRYEKGGYMEEGGETAKFQVDDVVYHKGHKTVGIVRMGEERGEVKTDADGNVNVSELEYYNPLKNEAHKHAIVAPSTMKEIEERMLWKPFSERTSQLKKGGYMAKGGATEHGLKRGDTIWADQFWENTVIVDNPETGRAVVNLETGKRKEQGKI